jgi:hypothetical protein
LRQPIGDHQQHHRMVPHPEVAALDLDALAQRPLALVTAVPRGDRVGPAEDRRRRYRQRLGEDRAIGVLVRERPALDEAAQDRRRGTGSRA